VSHDDERDDEDAATVIGRTDAVQRAMARPGVESPTRPFDVESISGPTRAMPSGYGLSRGGLGRFPAARPSAPRPAAGRPAVPSFIDDPTSESEMTLIEAIDAELDSITAELSIPEGTDPDMLNEPSAGGGSSEMTIRMAVPDDLPSSLLDATSEPGTQIQPPRAPPPPSIAEMARPAGRVPVAPLSLSSMPTPPRQTRTEPMPRTADAPPPAAAGADAPPDVSPASVAAPASVLERPRGPAPRWVGRYIVACFVVSLLGALVLGYLKMQRYW